MTRTTNGVARRSAADWERLLSEHTNSGQTQRGFCAERGIAVSTFCYWRRRLRSGGAADSGDDPVIELPILTGAG